jgi:hypothetical protein
MRCPLLIRSTSEDVITGELVQVMRTINPRWWLADFLNTALGARRFHQQVYRRLRIEPWVNHRPYPEELLPWKEGSTQVDIEISWENPPTTVFIEAKYQAELSWNTSNSGGQKKYPGDQLIRNIRVGLHHCGYFAGKRLFETIPRDFVAILLTPRKEHPLVQRYRREDTLRRALPHNHRLTALPRQPFVGELNYLNIKSSLRRLRRLMTPSERHLSDSLLEYVHFKYLSTLATPPTKPHASFD